MELTLLYFTASWCPPCRVMAPVFEEVEKELVGKVAFRKIDVDQNALDAAKHGVMSVPTFIVLKDGREVSRKVGALSKDEFISWIRGYE